MYNMQQLRRCLTLKMAPKFPEHRIFDIVTSNSMLANPMSSPSVSFLLAVRQFTMIPYICEMHCSCQHHHDGWDVIAPYRHQCIANHLRYSFSISRFISSHHHNIHIPLRPLNIQYLRKIGSSANCWFLCCWQWVRLCWAHIIAIPSMMIQY